jgi:hypothetical protein
MGKMLSFLKYTEEGRELQESGCRNSLVVIGSYGTKDVEKFVGIR